MSSDVPGYDVTESLYESARTVVLRACRTHDRHPVVLKVLRRDPATQEDLALYQEEFETLRRVEAPKIIRAFAFERYRQTAAIVLEDIGGESLDRWLRRRRSEDPAGLPATQGIAIAVEVAEALWQVHASGVTHRDINPTNIVFNHETRELRIVDFGLATNLRKNTLRVGSAPVEGTLAYLSPEQTGRIGRPVDHRTDLYAFGVTLYEILTGRLPFEDDDPLSLVHAHMAKAPRPLSDLSPRLPAVLSDIVMKLLAKAPRDRYQSILGVWKDLEHCLTLLQDGLIPSSESSNRTFTVGQHDEHTFLEIPDALYGRSGERALLLDALGQARQGRGSVVLVLGAAGAGKSALASDLREPTTQCGGYFLHGKFDQYAGSTPYTALIQACERGLELLLTQPATEVGRLRSAMIDELGQNVSTLLEVVPSLARFFGEQPAPARVGPQETLNRLRLAFRSLAHSIACPAHPVVLFIDDLQWADAASLDILKALAMDETLGSWVLILAYRDNEIGEDHPVVDLLSQLTAADVSMTTLALSNLECPEVERIVRDSLHCSQQDAESLGQIVFGKTRGNVFFVRQLLGNLWNDGALSYSYREHRWMWDAAHIAGLTSTDDVVDLVSDQLKKLAPRTSRLLSIGACLGSEFDVRTLALVADETRVSTLQALAPALQKGLLVDLSRGRRVLDASDDVRLAFLHDRVRQACYDAFDASSRMHMHLTIARVLLRVDTSHRSERRELSIVEHFQKAGAALSDSSERASVVDLYLRAADLAWDAAAYQACRDYLEQALLLMPSDAWVTQYERMLKIHSQLASCFSLTGETERLALVHETTTWMARTASDRSGVELARIMGLLTQGRLEEAVTRCLEHMAALGVDIPRNPTGEEAFRYFADTAAWFTTARIRELPRLPYGSREVGTILEASALINSPVYGANPHLSFVMIARLARLCVEQGLAPWAPVSLANFALLLCAVLNDIPKARLLTDVIMELAERRFDALSLISSLNALAGGFIIHRYDHLRATLPVLKEGAKKGLSTGAFTFVAHCAWWHASHLLFLGSPLDRVERDARSAVETCLKVRMRHLHRWCSLVLQVTLNLQGKSSDPLRMVGEAANEDELLTAARQANDYAEVFRVLLYRAWLGFLFGRKADAVKLFREAEGYLLYGVGLYFVPVFWFYDSLAHAAIHDESPLQDRAAILARVKRGLSEMDIWARDAPMNHGHKLTLMQAEEARIEGRYWDALDAYQKATRGAAREGFAHEEAMAHELCANFLREHDQEELAQSSARRARDLYVAWGASTKVRQLDAASVRDASALTPQKDPAHRSSSQPPRSRSSPAEPPRAGEYLDIVSLLRAQQTLSRTVMREELHSAMIRLVLQNAGAERVHLLYRDDSNWLVVARGRVNDERIEPALRQPLAEASDLSQTIVNYAIQLDTKVVLADASQHPQFAAETYVRTNAIRSVLAVPIRHQASVKLLVYLENNAIAGAFTDTRLETIELLSAQMAISMENALMYERLETLVQSRTAEVAERRRAQADLQQRNRELSLLNRVIGASEEEETGSGVLGATCRELVDAFDVDYALALTLDGARGEATVVGFRERGAPPCLISKTFRWETDPVVTRVVTQRSPVLTPPLDGSRVAGSRLDKSAATVCVGDMFWERTTVSLLAIPVVFDNTVLAVLELGCAAVRSFTSEDVELADCVARQIAGVLARLRLAEERRRLEEQYHQAQKMEALGRLTGGVVHDFNNMLTIVLGSCEIAFQGVGPGTRAREAIEQIQSTARRASVLTGQLLAFSRRQLLRPEVVSLNQIVSSVERMLRTLMGEGADLRIALASDLGHVQADAGQLEQVIMNLVVNARDALPNGGRIDIETRNVDGRELCLEPPSSPLEQAVDDPTKQYVMLTVTDNGTGMSPETKARAFEPFFTTKEKGKGTGLGLATVHGIVAQSGGHVSIASAIGRGTTIRVCLPRVRAVLATEKRPSLPVARANGQETILLVEDEATLRDLSAGTLAGRGYQVLSAGNAKEARGLVASCGRRIDLLLTDVMIPGGVNGVELSMELREQRPDLRILYVSGYADNTLLDPGTLPKGTAFLQKPFTPLELADKVRETLDSRAV